APGAGRAGSRRRGSRGSRDSRGSRGTREGLSAMPYPIGEILFLIFLTFLEGFFVAAEIALVSVRRSRIDQLVEEGSTSARRVRRLIDDPGQFLAVSQLGLTLIGFFASAFAAVSLVTGLASLLESLGVAAGSAESAALIVVTIVLAL